jgi:hypothetical protein
MNPFCAFQVCGTVEAVQVTARGARNFRVAEILLRLDEESAVQIEATHERVGAAQRLQPGQVVLISGYARSRKVGERWFTALSALVIAEANGSQVGRPTSTTRRSSTEHPPQDPGPSGGVWEDPY